MSFGQFAASLQFYIFGKSHCTRTGWERAILKYPKPDILEDSLRSLAGHVYMITGANTGIGKEISTFLAKKGATVYMVCRSQEKAQKARDEIVALTQSPSVHILTCDCSLESDVRKMWKNFEASEIANAAEGKSTTDIATRGGSSGPVRLDGLVCNAGALLNEKTFTSEGVEVTFAAHLLFGTYLLGSLAMETLEATENSRLIFVSSGGMYNTKFPKWEDAISTGSKAYDGQFAYAFAKRGQVLLAEVWGALHPKVKVVSCHPGWTLTDGVEAAYGKSKSYLEPLRTLWQGAEGIIWLCMADAKDLKSGEFYLDRSPQVKHMAGPFFMEGSHTKNTPEDVDTMVSQLKKWSSTETRPTLNESLKLAARQLPLVATTTPVDIPKFMGKWYVMANIPMSLEQGASNCVENYHWDADQKTIDVLFEYIPKGGAPETPKSKSEMHAKIVNNPVNSFWALNPKILGLYLPLGLSYLVLEVAEDGSYALIGVPDRSYLWVLTRLKPTIKEGGPYKKSAAVSHTATVTTPSEGKEGEKVCVAAAREIFECNPDMEESIMQRALATAADLGYDTDKVLNVKWSV